MPETTALTLYKIDETISELVAMREDPTMTDEEQIVIDRQLTEWVERELQKVSACWGYIRHEEQLAEMARQVAEEATRWRHTHENRAQRVRDMVRSIMERDGLPRVQGAVGSFTLRTSGGVRPLLPVDMELLPAEYKRVELSIPLPLWGRVQTILEAEPEALVISKVVVDKALVREALEGGKDVPGAKLGDRTKSLMVR